jgi:hypothetical protein
VKTVKQQHGTTLTYDLVQFDGFRNTEQLSPDDITLDWI